MPGPRMETQPACPARPQGGMQFPPAMAYVPVQQWSQTFDPGEALERGTLFPELDLPFMAMGGSCQ